MKRLSVFFLIFIISLWALILVAIGQRSSGFVYHVVKPKENVYRISLLYNVPIDSIKSWNNLDPNNTVFIGMKLIINRQNSIRTEISQKPQGKNGSTGHFTANNQTVVHIVAEKENLFRLSKHYNVSIDSLRVWNNLGQDYVIIKGTKLVVRHPILKPDRIQEVKKSSTYTGLHTVTGKENVFRISLRYHVPIDSIRIWNDLDQNFTVFIGQRLKVSNPSSEILDSEPTSGNKSIQPSELQPPATPIDNRSAQPSDSSKVNESNSLFDTLADVARGNYLPILSEPEANRPDSTLKGKILFFYNKSNYIFRGILFVNLFFFILAIIVAIVILIRRLRDARIKRAQNKCVDRYRDFLMNWLYEEHANTLPESLLMEFKDSVKREVFVSELISLHSNLIGESADALIELYNIAGLKEYSVLKVKSKTWYIKAKGFRELAQMKIKEGAQLIKPYLNSKNAILRIEAQQAWIQLNPEDPIGFYDTPDIHLTLWGELNSLVALKKIGNIPDFRKWLTVLNKDVALFAIKLSGLFKQFENADLVSQRLKDKDSDIRREAIITLGKMAVPSPVHELQELFFKEKVANKVEILLALIMIYDMSNIPFFEEVLLKETDNYLRILAARGLNSLDGDGKDQLEQIFANANDDTLLKNIIVHAKDPRI